MQPPSNVADQSNERFDEQYAESQNCDLLKNKRMGGRTNEQVHSQVPIQINWHGTNTALYGKVHICEIYKLKCVFLDENPLDDGMSNSFT